MAYLCIWTISPRRLLSDSWKDEALFFILGLVGGTVYFVAENTAIGLSYVNNVSFIVCTAPLITMLLAILFIKSVKATVPLVLGSLIALVGVAIVIYNGHFVLRLNPLGDFLALTAAFSWAIYSLVIKKVSPFTLVGATTRSGMLTAPLRARFGINMHLEYYEPDVLKKIIKRSASILQVPIDDEAAVEISRRSRGTPRIANALLRRVRDFAQVKGNGRIDLKIAHVALEALNIDQYGLDEIDNKILLTIIDKFKGGPVGLNTIGTAIGEDAGTIEDVYEPFLIMEGFIKRTPGLSHHGRLVLVY